MNKLFLLLIMLFVSTPVFAFMPTDEQQKERRKVVSPLESNKKFSKEILLGLERFNKGYNNKWKIRFNAETGIPKKIFGYHTAPVKGRPCKIARAFLSENQALLRIETKNLKLLKVAENRKFNHVVYQQIYQGLLVERANLSLSLTKDGQIVSIDSNYHPEIKTPITPIIHKSRAIEITKDYLGPKSPIIRSEVTLVVLPKDKGILSWKVRFFCHDPLGDWIYYIAADSGKIIEKYNNLRFQTSGRVMGKVFPSVGSDPLHSVPFAHEEINIGTSQTTTDDGGYYSSAGTGLISSELKGPYVDVDNEDTSDARYIGEWNEINYSISSLHPYPNKYEGTWTITHPGAEKIKVHFSKFETEQEFDYVYIYDGSSTVVGTYTGTKGDFWSEEVEGDTIGIYLKTDESGTAHGFDIDKYAFPTGNISPSWIWSYSPQDTHCDEVNVFYHLNLLHDYYKNTHNYNLDCQMKAVVHYGTDYDNAFYYPSENVICFGDGDVCEDFARSRDVIYHEYTHAVVNHIYNLLPYGQPGAMDEALADYFAASICNDSNIGEWVMPKGNQRNLVNTYRYPEDWQGEVHDDGRIYAGALWKIREALGKEEADKLIFESLFFQPQSFKEGLEAILLVDDDDGDLSNGTPHQTEIETAFLNHGITLTESSDTYEPNDSFSQAYQLTSKNIYESYIFAPGDMDYYKIWANGGIISISLTSIPFASDYDLYLYDPSYKTVAKSINEGSENENIYYDLGTSSGLYYILVTGWKKYYSPSNSYLLQATFSYGKEDNSPPLGLPGTPIDRGVYGDLSIIFTWTKGTLDDPESGIAGYWLQVGTSPGKGDKFDGDIGNVLSKTIFDCENGKTYYARARARNGAGLYGSYSDVSDGITINIPLPTLATINPNIVLNTGLIKATLNGTNFVSGTDVRLRKSSQPDIIANKIMVENSNKIICDFDLSKAQPGKWDVVISNTKAKSCVLSKGFKVLMNPAKKGVVVAEDEKTKVEFTSFAIGEGYYINFDLNPGSAKIDTANYKDDADPTYNRIPDSVTEITGYNENDAPITNNFMAPATVTIPYLDLDQDGVVDNSNPPLREVELAVYRIIGTGSVAHWQRLEGSKVNSDSNTVSAPISSFSVYVLMGLSTGDTTTLSNIYVYPNPFSSSASGITFRGLPTTEEVEIKIYNVAGELIIDKKHITGSSWQWNAHNKSGKKVASGIYIYSITNNRNQKIIGKLAIIR
ncbi:MAG: T9SS type A sorting domain-containing protein [bacterium]|nr:T9SS type A sorting domain-containing protein [bacterium]